MGVLGLSHCPQESGQRSVRSGARRPDGVRGCLRRLVAAQARRLALSGRLRTRESARIAGGSARRLASRRGRRRPVARGRLRRGPETQPHLRRCPTTSRSPGRPVGRPRPGRRRGRRWRLPLRFVDRQSRKALRAFAGGKPDFPSPSRFDETRYDRPAILADARAGAREVCKTSPPV